MQMKWGNKGSAISGKIADKEEIVTETNALRSRTLFNTSPSHLVRWPFAIFDRYARVAAAVPADKEEGRRGRSRAAARLFLEKPRPDGLLMSAGCCGR